MLLASCDGTGSIGAVRSIGHPRLVADNDQPLGNLAALVVDRDRLGEDRGLDHDALVLLDPADARFRAIRVDDPEGRQ